ncbi:hypothetical protein ABO04_06090 [Nitrosomonas sp. HPC101]|nr:hypothetical protein [Nitrosomonas sp. HPC101]
MIKKPGKFKRLRAEKMVKFLFLKTANFRLIWGNHDVPQASLPAQTIQACEFLRYSRGCSKRWLIPFGAAWNYSGFI